MLKTFKIKHIAPSPRVLNFFSNLPHCTTWAQNISCWCFLAIAVSPTAELEIGAENTILSRGNHCESRHGGYCRWTSSTLAPSHCYYWSPRQHNIFQTGRPLVFPFCTPSNLQSKSPITRDWSDDRRVAGPTLEPVRQQYQRSNGGVSAAIKSS